MQELPLETAPIAPPAVHRIANDRQSRVGQVCADLMRAAGHRANMEERPALASRAPRRRPRETRDRLAAAGAHNHPAAVVGIAQQWRLDDRRRIAGIAPDEREVFLL